MRWPLRFLAVSAVFAASALIASNTSLAEDLGIDVWHVPDLQDRVAAAESRDVELSRESTVVLRRLDWRSDVVADLIAGRISGGDAHARFLDANQSHPKATQYLRRMWPGRSDEERTARQLVVYVRVSGHPGAAADLECELAAHLTAE